MPFPLLLCLAASGIIMLASNGAQAASASIRANGYEPPEKSVSKSHGSEPARAGVANPASGSDGPDANAGRGQAVDGVVVLIRRGDTLDKLVQTHLGKLPMRTDWLRQAVIQKNPGLFRDGRPRPLPAGARLTLPTLAELRKLLPVELSGLEPAEQEEPSVQQPMDPRKGWVRYP